MKYKQMSLRDAFYYLRSRRPIIGPNFGFIKQLIAYEKSLFGSTSVSFIDTPVGSVPDIYLSIEGTRRYRTATTIPIEITNRTNSFINRSTNQNLRMNNNNDHRPITSVSNNSSFLHDRPRYNLTSTKPFGSIREPYISTRLNALRTGKYVPSFFNHYYLP